MKQAIQYNDVAPMMIIERSNGIGHTDHTDHILPNGEKEEKWPHHVIFRVTKKEGQYIYGDVLEWNFSGDVRDPYKVHKENCLHLRRVVKERCRVCK